MAGKTSSQRPRRATSRARSQDALNLLKQDYARVKSLFGRFEKARGKEQKAKLAATMCSELNVHAQLEERVFYPAVRQVIEEEELPEDRLFDAKVKVLGEYVNHHVKEEEGEMFREIRRTDLDLGALGQRMKRRKQELQSRQSAGTMRRQPSGDAAGAVP
ncbi:MAG: hemerythrin domain-containing protein [Gammaproteobacteria bacterium]